MERYYFGVNQIHFTTLWSRRIAIGCGAEGAALCAPRLCGEWALYIKLIDDNC
jgi:hypothetical protein